MVTSPKIQQLNMKLFRLMTKSLSNFLTKKDARILTKDIIRKLNTVTTNKKRLKNLGWQVLSYLLNPKVAITSSDSVLSRALEPSIYFTKQNTHVFINISNGALCPKCSRNTGILVPVGSTRMGSCKTGSMRYSCTSSGCNIMWD
jgi:hypothetical protein